MGLPWWFWSIVASIGVNYLEYLNRAGGFSSYWAALPATWWVILISQMGLFYCWRDSPSLLLGWATFFLANTFIRIGNVTWAIGEVPTPTHLAGIALVCAGAFTIKAG
ncbi:MAG: hypothetical protein ACR2N5_00915 [Solirubrobacterales bacterium]